MPFLPLVQKKKSPVVLLRFNSGNLMMSLMILFYSRHLGMAITTGGHQRAKISNQYIQRLQVTKNLIPK